MNLNDNLVALCWINYRKFGNGWFFRETVTAWHKEHLAQREQLMRDFVWISS